MDGVLSIFHDPGIWINGYWDTLVWFGAGPGDRWEVLQPEDFLCPSFFTLTDTGHTEIAGESLHFVRTTIVSEGEEAPGPMFVERIGSVRGIFFGECGTGDPDTTLRCYSDVGMSYSTMIAPDCDLVDAIGEDGPQSRSIHVFPNPGTDQVTITDPNGQWIERVIVRDALGRVCQEKTMRSDRVVLDVEALLSGCYTIQAFTEEGKQRTVQWIKQ